MTTTDKPRSKQASRGLGKGLSALMGESTYVAPTAPARPAAKETGREEKGRDEKNREKKDFTQTRPEFLYENGAAVTMLLDDIVPGKYQPREFFNQAALLELADSIRRQGLVQPLVVREIKGGKHEIIAGERRWRAARMAGLNEIPVIVRIFTDKQALETAIVENIQREDLNPLEEAAGYQRLMDEFSYTQEQLGTSVNKSRSHVANLLRLLELPEEIRQLLLENRISMGHARALVGVEDNIALAQEIVEKGLSVRQVEKMARLGKEPSPYMLRKQREMEEEQKSASFSVPVAPRHEGPAPVAAKPAPQPVAQQPVAQPAQMALPVQQPVVQQPVAQQPAQHQLPARPAHRDPDIMALEETLSENLGLKVSINDRGQAGEITVSYDSLEQLDDILRRLGGSI